MKYPLNDIIKWCLQYGVPTVRGSGQVGVDSVDLGVPRGRAPKVPEKAGQVSLDFIRTRPKVPPWDPEVGPRRFGGRGRSGLTL